MEQMNEPGEFDFARHSEHSEVSSSNSIPAGTNADYPIGNL